MALTDEQNNTIEFETARETARAGIINPEFTKQRKMEALRMAQAVINENRRLKSASEVSDVSASDLTTLANTLITYIDS
jgi:hypothetical protein